MRFVEESLLRRIKKTQEIQRKDNKEIEKSRKLASSRGRKTWGRRRRRRSVKCNPFALDCLGICVLFMLRAPYSVLSSGSWCSFSLSQQLLGERRKGEKLNQDRGLFLYWSCCMIHLLLAIFVLTNLLWCFFWARYFAVCPCVCVWMGVLVEILWKLSEYNFYCVAFLHYTSVTTSLLACRSGCRSLFWCSDHIVGMNSLSCWSSLNWGSGSNSSGFTNWTCAWTSGCAEDVILIDFKILCEWRLFSADLRIPVNRVRIPVSWL